MGFGCVRMWRCGLRQLGIRQNRPFGRHTWLSPTCQVWSWWQGAGVESFANLACCVCVHFGLQGARLAGGCTPCCQSSAKGCAYAPSQSQDQSECQNQSCRESVAAYIPLAVRARAAGYWVQHTGFCTNPYPHSCVLASSPCWPPRPSSFHILPQVGRPYTLRTLLAPNLQQSLIKKSLAVGVLASPRTLAPHPSTFYVPRRSKADCQGTSWHPVHLRAPRPSTPAPCFILPQVGGYLSKYEELTFATIRGAGHMCPYSQPERTHMLVSHFVRGEPLPLHTLRGSVPCYSDFHSDSASLPCAVRTSQRTSVYVARPYVVALSAQRGIPPHRCGWTVVVQAVGYEGDVRRSLAVSGPTPALRFESADLAV
eukprot:137062-Chlamydomonas_euryale.AAC.5